MSPPIDDRTEWLEADGLGGFASGTTSGIRTRRYHALLLAATTPPTGRMVLVNGLDASIERPGGVELLTAQRYAPGLVAPAERAAVLSFSGEPWPTWIYRLADGSRVEQELFAPHGLPALAIRWRRLDGGGPLPLAVRPFLSGRDTHALHAENPVLRFDAEVTGGRVTWRPYTGVPAVVALSNGRFAADPAWYRRFQYDEELARGFEGIEDLAAPGVFRFDLERGEAVMILAAEHPGLPRVAEVEEAGSSFARLRRRESARRGRLIGPLERAADAYLAERGTGRTIVAGYPWFTDWSRDTFIAIRGLCLASGRLRDARAILLEWAGLVSEGMLPNRFVDAGDSQEYNSVDGSLWYAVAAHEYLAAVAATGRAVPARDRAALAAAVLAIVDGYARGTRFGIRLDDDGLLAAGGPGVQLTWMDARVDGREITPRTGKPVEVQALWLNALRAAESLAADPEPYAALRRRGAASFAGRFWNPERGCLYDVVDVDHVHGTADPAIRPNQVLAVGGLPFPVLGGARARSVMDVVERELLTPIGLRSLAPGEPGYVRRYSGDSRARDGAYHQGTVWPWLLGPFIEGWVRVRGGGADIRRKARERFFSPLLAHVGEAGLGHVSEIADAEAPFTPRGCPFQAWSVGEAIRLDRLVLGPMRPAKGMRGPAGVGAV